MGYKMSYDILLVTRPEDNELKIGDNTLLMGSVEEATNNLIFKFKTNFPTVDNLNIQICNIIKNEIKENIYHITTKIRDTTFEIDDVNVTIMKGVLYRGYILYYVKQVSNINTRYMVYIVDKINHDRIEMQGTYKQLLFGELNKEFISLKDIFGFESKDAYLPIDNFLRTIIEQNKINF